MQRILDGQLGIYIAFNYAYASINTQIHLHKHLCPYSLAIVHNWRFECSNLSFKNISSWKGNFWKCNFQYKDILKCWTFLEPWSEEDPQFSAKRVLDLCYQAHIFLKGFHMSKSSFSNLNTARYYPTVNSVLCSLWSWCYPNYLYHFFWHSMNAQNRCGFEGKGEIWVEDILNLGVSWVVLFSFLHSFKLFIILKI